jgi:hypothetical protein
MFTAFQESKGKEKMTTLVQTFILGGPSLVEDIYIFVCEHNDDLDGKVIEALGAAFKDWYVSTDEGKEYVDENGVNYGDATYIPDKWLRKHGIEGFCPLSDVSDDGLHVDTFKYQDKITVNHDDSLFDLGEADEEIDQKAGLIEKEAE